MRQSVTSVLNWPRLELAESVLNWPKLANPKLANCDRRGCVALRTEPNTGPSDRSCHSRTTRLLWDRCCSRSLPPCSQSPIFWRRCRRCVCVREYEPLRWRRLRWSPRAVRERATSRRRRLRHNRGSVCVLRRLSMRLSKMRLSRFRLSNPPSFGHRPRR